MKKVILPAIISALLASPAYAANIYDADGTTADLYGRMQFDISDDGTTTTDSDGSLDGVGSARIGTTYSSMITSEITAIAKGEWQIAAENSDDSEFTTRHLYAGFSSDEMGSLIFGQTDSAFYNAVAATDIYNTYGYGAFDGVDRQEGQIIYSGEFSGLSIDASYQFQDKNFTGLVGLDDDATASLDKAYAITLGYNVEGLGISAGTWVQQFEDYQDKTSYAVSLNYTLNDLYLAAVYLTADQDGSSDIEEANNYDGYDLLASYVINDAKLYGGYTFQEADDNTDMTDEVTLGAQYAVNNNLITWVEYKADQINGNDDVWTAAIQYNF